ncbi:MAG TPA: carboxymuconolactone decarboxylase family protein [Actinomycetota bacterium]|nr:carboxymuconolactone decarboxylase family protein [Actinomycetota bacterium]
MAEAPHALPRDHGERGSVPLGSDLLGSDLLGSELGRTLTRVPRSARWVLPVFAAAFRGTEVSTLEPRLRALALLRVAAIDRSPYWREQHEAAAPALGITRDELDLVASDEWETAPAFGDRERAAILWADRVARRLGRRDAVAYRTVREHLDERELVELTAAVSLACMADRLTNALRIAPEPPTGLSPGGHPVDESLARWSREMFDRLPVGGMP